MSYLQSKYLTVQNYDGLVIEAMAGKDWKPILELGVKLLEQNHFECQLGSGTLLGAIREDDHLIHHDTDIDIDIIVKNPKQVLKKTNNIIKKFSEEGFKVVRTQIYHHPNYGQLPIQVAFIHKKTNIIFDLCYFYNIWGTDWCNVYEHGVFFRPAYSVEETMLFSIDDVAYNIPRNYNKYLIGRYGIDWRVPKTGKESGEKDAANYLIVL